MDPGTHRTLHFGPFLLDPERRALFKGKERLSITGKGFDMLLMLVENRGAVVTKKDFLAALWSDTAVEEASVTQNVYSLRKLLGDDSKQHQYIATLAGRGYRFIAPVRELPSESEPFGSSDPISADAVRQQTPGPRLPSTANAGMFRPVSRAGLLVLLALAIGVVTKTVWRSGSGRAGLPELEQRQLTSNAAENAVASGAISADGKYLAYADWTGLHVKSVEPGTAQDLGTIPASNVEATVWTVGGWLPDGSRFVANAVVRRRSSAMWLIAPYSGAFTKLQDDAFGWSTSADGSAVVFTRQNTFFGRSAVTGREIWAYNLRTGQTRQLVSAAAGMRYSDVRWTPDGKSFAYLADGQHPGTHEKVIEECDAAGQGCRALLEGLPLKSFVLLRDGRLLASIMEPEPNGTSCNLWITASGSPQLRRLTDWQGACLDALTSTSDGSKLALRKFSAVGTTYVAQLLRGGSQISLPIRLNYSKGQEGPQAWLHDNRTLLLASNRTGHWEILKQGIGERGAQPLVAEANSTGRPTVTSDGRWILYMVGPRSLDAAFYAGPVRLMRVSATGGTPVEVTQLRNSDWLQCPSRAGSNCVLIRKRDAGKGIVLRSFDPFNGIGPEIMSYPIEPTDQYMFALSESGTRVAITTKGTPQIKILSLVSGAVDVVTTDSANDWNSIAWMPGDRGFVVSLATPTGMMLLDIDLTGRTHILWDERGATRTWGVPSYDGRLLAILNWTDDSNIWTVQGF